MDKQKDGMLTNVLGEFQREDRKETLLQEMHKQIKNISGTHNEEKYQKETWS